MLVCASPQSRAAIGERQTQPATYSPVDHLDRDGAKTDIVEQPRMLTAFAN
jgi:hypothetical protein